MFFQPSSGIVKKNYQLTALHILEASYLQGGYQKQLVIQGIDLTVIQGEWLSVLGANGSGKSTLLKLIGRILAQDQTDPQSQEH